MVAENRARENPDRLRGALYSLRRRQKWTVPTFVNFTWDKDVKRHAAGPVVEGWPPWKNRSGNQAGLREIRSILSTHYHSIEGMRESHQMRESRSLSIEIREVKELTLVVDEN